MTAIKLTKDNAPAPQKELMKPVSLPPEPVAPQKEKELMKIVSLPPPPVVPQSAWALPTDIQRTKTASPPLLPEDASDSLPTTNPLPVRVLSCSTVSLGDPCFSFDDTFVVFIDLKRC